MQHRECDLVMGGLTWSHPTSSRNSSHSNVYFQLVFLALWHFTPLGN